RRLHRQRLRELRRLGAAEVVEELLFLLDLLVRGVEFLDDALGRERVFLVRRVQEDAGERVVILRWNRIVLMIVTARAPDRQPEETARKDVDPVVTFVGARHFDSAVVVVPTTQTEETGRRPRRRARPLAPRR